jgi:MFS family permease
VSWHWIFFINLPVGVVTFWLGSVLVDETEGIGLRRGVDIVGSILVTAAMVLGVYSIVTAAQYGWASAHTFGFGAAAVGLLASFLVLEGRIANPIMPLRVLRIRSLIGASVARAMLATGMFATFFLGTLYLQHVRGYSAVETGLAFLPWSISLGVLSLGITANLMRRFGPRHVLVPGMLAIVTSLVVMATAGENASYFPVLLGAYTLFGIGAGTSFMPLITIAMSEVPPEDAGLASGIANVSMQISAAIGLAALGTISSGHSTALVAQGYSLSSALTGGYQLSFGIAAACVAVGLLVVLVVLRPSGARRDAPVTSREWAEGTAEAA